MRAAAVSQLGPAEAGKAPWLGFRCVLLPMISQRCCREHVGLVIASLERSRYRYRYRYLVACRLAPTPDPSGFDVTAGPFENTGQTLGDCLRPGAGGEMSRWTRSGRLGGNSRPRWAGRWPVCAWEGVGPRVFSVLSLRRLWLLFSAVAVGAKTTSACRCCFSCRCCSRLCRGCCCSVL